jgi:hypothetical protein
MKKEFIPYEQALALKKLGFDEPCFGYYRTTLIPSNYTEYFLELERGMNDDFEDNRNYFLLEDTCSAPTFSQAFRWLLDKHHLYGVVIPTVTMDWTFKTMTVAQGMVEVPPYNHVDACDYSSREEAELACLKKLIEIVKQKL